MVDINFKLLLTDLLWNSLYLQQPIYKLMLKHGVRAKWVIYIWESENEDEQLCCAKLNYALREALSCFPGWLETHMISGLSN